MNELGMHLESVWVIGAQFLKCRASGMLHAHTCCVGCFASFRNDFVNFVAF